MKKIFIVLMMIIGMVAFADSSIDALKKASPAEQAQFLEYVAQFKKQTVESKAETERTQAEYEATKAKLESVNAKYEKLFEEK